MTATEQETTATSIDQVVRTTMDGRGWAGYRQYAEPVVEALTSRETGLSEKLIDFAVDAGADEVEIRAYLTEIGMAVPAEPEPEVDDDEDEESDEPGDGVADMLRRIDQRLDSLTDFARRNGYRG